MILLLFVGLIPTVHAQKPTEREKKMLDEINRFRQNPMAALPEIDKYLEFWESDASERAAAKELIAELKKLKPLPAIEFSQELYEQARKHGEWMKKYQKFQHSKNNVRENLVSGNEDITMAVIDLLIDDGVSNRGHRKNILHPENKIGACYEIIGEIDGIDFNFVQVFD